MRWMRVPARSCQPRPGPTRRCSKLRPKLHCAISSLCSSRAPGPCRMFVLCSSTRARVCGFMYACVCLYIYICVACRVRVRLRLCLCAALWHLPRSEGLRCDTTHVSAWYLRALKPRLTRYRETKTQKIRIFPANCVSLTRVDWYWHADWEPGSRARPPNVSNHGTAGYPSPS